MFYSKATGGFYSTEVHGDAIPEGAVEITNDEYKALMDGNRAGKQITADSDGNPALSDPPALTGRQITLLKIAELEKEETPRRLREAALTEAGKQWLLDNDAAIAALRETL